VLDVGCDTGTLLTALASQTEAALIGVDGDPGILKAAKAKVLRSAAANRVDRGHGRRVAARR
jgi:ribosomal protein L11 methylase PrmA